MSSVTARIKEVKQPRGGYINPKMFAVTQFNDGKQLAKEENVHASIIGMVVDYLTRYMRGTPVSDAFAISILGARAAALFGEKAAINEINAYLSKIKGLDDISIIAACKAVTYDVWYRNAASAPLTKGANDTNPDRNTISNIRLLVERSLTFFEKYGPITKDGFTFEPFGYTEAVSSGDGDFLTEDTLWDFKVSVTEPTNKHTLQLLMYWIMGQHSGKIEFKKIVRLGIFNPRLNKVYLIEMSNIPKETISSVERDVICY